MALLLAASACGDGEATGPRGPAGVDGQEGPAGPEGPAGATGSAGESGDDGLAMLAVTSVEPPGDRCAEGGVRLDLGLDLDANGTLRENEIDPTLTRFVCHGATGPQGPQGLVGPQGPPGVQGLAGLDVRVKTTPEPAAPECEAGAVRLEFGVDADRDGLLATEELDPGLTQLLCNGATGAPGPQGIEGQQGLQGDAGLSTLAEISAADPAACPTGGARIEVGLDADRDGQLGLAEVDLLATRHVCNGAVGPQGLRGDTGPQGPQGLQGEQGPQGAQGPMGLQGMAGPGGHHAVVRTTAEAAGANCPTGGVRLEAGSDTNGNAVLDGGEVNAALTRYVCNGAQGPQGAAGAAGPQGPAGNLAAYGDGSAGALSIAVGQTLDLTTDAGVASLPAGANFQFTNVTVSGSLIVPSGTLFRATGSATVSGTIVVATGAADIGPGDPHPGVSLAAANVAGGGIGLGALQAGRLVRIPLFGGGAGNRVPTASGGEGGGSFSIVAQGPIAVPLGGSIHANGGNGFNPETAGLGILGPGGGAGGLVVLVSKSAISVGGAIRANGGNGDDGWNGNGGSGEGAGGGGGGGIVHLLAPAMPAVTGTVQVSGGAPGVDAPGTGTTAAGGGGGACGGNGGMPGSLIGGIASPATAGQAGRFLRTVAPTPENLLF